MHFLLFTIVIIFASPAFCWTGYNYDTGSYFEVERYDHQGLGEGPVEYYDYNSGEYKSGYLDLFPGASGILYDEDTGEEFDIQME
ncbi:hypothetical protein JP33_04865 [Gallibacterium anatis CCM5995]|uniref:hypothetical protein n=1 Tax=Gallibacterium anatis TaxID=750 RepID=UPI00053171DF|nr:hypothetical protein [Gallibacterium anatis]KGQ26347.1 hypothetical protein JP33_04865 [Gallibacterium anatis CCM5995]